MSRRQMGGPYSIPPMSWGLAAISQSTASHGGVRTSMALLPNSANRLTTVSQPEGQEELSACSAGLLGVPRRPLSPQSDLDLSYPVSK